MSDHFTPLRSKGLRGIQTTYIEACEQKRLDLEAQMKRKVFTNVK